MSNFNDPNKKSFISMFGTKTGQGNSGSSSSSFQSSAPASQGAGQGERASFFKSFVKDDKGAKPGFSNTFGAQAKPEQKPSFLGAGAKSAEQSNSFLKSPAASPMKKNVNIPIDISKLTLEEKIAILEKINADIENEAKSEKRLIPPSSARPGQLSSQAAGAKPTASQLFKTSSGGLFGGAGQAKDGAMSLFGNKSTDDSATLASNANAIRSPLARRAAGADTTSNDIKITNEEFVILRNFLYEQCGIFVGENRKYLMENRLNTRLRELGLHSFSEYHNYLRYDKNKTSELNELFINMTTNETSFFRNNVQLDIFRDKVLARIIAEQRAKGDRRINIWSAGCSSGEEPYTIAIILLELLGSDIVNWNIKITANDLSLAMLNIARKGVYSEYALRTTPPDMIEKYFIKEGKNFKIVPQAQRLVQFGQINLARADQIARVERSHVVFCRNVIIYFDDAMKKHVISSFYDNLLPGGFLLIGHSESLHNISRTFKPEHHPGAIIYCKQS